MTSVGVSKMTDLPGSVGVGGAGDPLADPSGVGDQVDLVDLLPLVVKAFKMAGIAITVWLWGYLGFSVAWVFIALFFHVASEECRKYKESKKTYALQAVLNEREAILSRVDDHSSWVYFPDAEKAEWFNKIIRQMWPYVGEYIKEVLKNSVEPSIQNNLPSNLKSFKFVSIDTGDIPPRVDGVKVYIDPKKTDEIICDIDLKYLGDANIKVAVKGLIAGIKSLTVSGTMRVIMKPLTSEVPIIGGLSVFFLNRPLVDFNLTAAANLLDAPLLNKSMRTIVEEQLAYYLVLPHRLPIQLASNIDFTVLKYPFPQGVMRLEVVEAKDLKRADSKMFGKGKSDPYCIIVVGAKEMKTKVLSNTINPIWKEHFQFVADQKHGQLIDLQVFDRDIGSNNDDSLGTANIGIDVLAKNGYIDLWYPLEDVKTGQVYIRAMWMTLTQDITLLPEAKTNAKQTDFGPSEGWSSGILLVTVITAKGLPLGVRSHRERNAFVRMKIGNYQEQTAVKMNCKDPVWNENFLLLVQDPESDQLTFEVFHRGKTEKKLATANCAVNEILTSDDMALVKTFPLAECGHNSSLTVRLALRILMSDVHPRWSGGTGLKLGRIASITSHSPSEPAPLSSAAAAGSKIKSTKREPSVELPTMMPFRSQDSANENQRTSRETTPKPAAEDLVFETVVEETVLITPTQLEAELVQIEDSLLKDSSNEREHLLERKPSSQPTPIKESSHARDIYPSAGSSRFGQIQLTIRYTSQRGQLVVVVHQCRNLIPCDKDNLADPYVRVYLLPDRNLKKRTKMMKNTLNPLFDETFEWPFATLEAPFRSLDIAVKNDVGLFSKSRTDMGHLVLELSKLGDLSKATTAWYDLDESKPA